jgi:hypothetical protein
MNIYALTSKAVYFLCIAVITLLTACQGTSEKEEWKVLFDGETLVAWRGLGIDTVPANWIIEDDCIRNLNRLEIPPLPDGQIPPGRDLITIDKFENFELYFEWKIGENGNSGVKYNVSEEMSTKTGNGRNALGFEYQMIDDVSPDYKDVLKPYQFTGALYDLLPPVNVILHPVGEFNTSRIIVDGNHCEHWLNGVKVVEFEFGSAVLDSAYQESKFVANPGFHEKRTGHIVLQNHSTDAWFRNIKIREL